MAFGLSASGCTGKLTIDAALARRIVDDALRGEEGAAAPVPAGSARLGVGEMGVVAGVVSRALAAFGAPLAVTLSASAGERSGSTCVAALDVTAAGRSGWAELELPAAWLAEVAQTPLDPGELSALAASARVELARTRVTAGALAALAPGDAVVFDGWPASGDDGPWPVELILGPHAATAVLAPGGRLTLVGAFGRPRAGARVDGADSQEVSNMSRESGSRDQEGAYPEVVTADATRVLALAPIEIVAEVGRLELRGEEVLGLRPGVVLSLASRRTAEVVLRVGHEVWAEGELVDVDGDLAVRVTRMLRVGLAKTT